MIRQLDIVLSSKLICWALNALYKLDLSEAVHSTIVTDEKGSVLK